MKNILSINLAVIELSLIQIYEYFNIILSYFLYLIFFILIGFIFNYFIFNLILIGFIGKTLKNNLLNKLNRNDLYWFNKLLFSFLIIYFIIFLSTNTIFLDTSIIVKLNESDISISGEYIDKIFTHFGASTAFVIGARLAAAFVAKHPMALTGKIGITIGTGAGSSAAFQMVNYGTGIIRGKILAQQGLNDGTINLHVKDVSIMDGNNIKNITNISTSEKLDPNILLPKFQFNSVDRISKFHDLYENKLKTVEMENSNSKIIQIIEKQNNCSLSEIFSRENSLENIINSPLELSEIGTSNIKNDLITMLSYNLTINLIMIYFIFMLIFIFLFKFVLDNNISLEKVKNLPLGYYIHLILSKLISA